MDIDDVWQVVRDSEGRYSVWRDGRPVPFGWKAIPFNGSRDECLAHIETTWCDSRPASWAQLMDSQSPTTGRS
ncbi:MbtH family NRPS accessory protein [Bradyrhizobium sp. CCGUVB1N3]|uniref:MbtH family protein n=1 Tax=Bradyrhizobium sp. CCGUVB1N3 TaxID=2949629 RepID=UPI0020B3DDCF|nr:MbtH family NRPS accessory protein [Bradyrhizobium sp. CCGUVB1N3]MCP3469092.1 MbtH family NRPS accessory protein [Bradyrhizobium sp. CCGUVB1N3]